MDQTRPLSVYLCPLGIAMTNKVYNLTISSKNCGWCSWDLNPGQQDERMHRRRRVCWAIDVGPPAQVVFIFGAKGVSESLSLIDSYMVKISPGAFSLIFWERRVVWVWSRRHFEISRHQSVRFVMSGPVSLLRNVPKWFQHIFIF